MKSKRKPIVSKMRNLPDTDMMMLTQNFSDSAFGYGKVNYVTLSKEKVTSNSSKKPRLLDSVALVSPKKTEKDFITTLLTGQPPDMDKM